MPSWKESATFSLHVYRDKDEPVLPPEWFLLMDCPQEYQSEGYFGAAYAKRLSGEENWPFYDVVIAHRGTILSWPDILEDLEMFFLQRVPDQFLKSALPFVTAVVAYLNQFYGQDTYRVSFTGHSLGAILAELSVAYWSEKSSMFEGARTFESPGSKPFILKLIQAGHLASDSLTLAHERIVICNADINAINSCFEHVGSLEAPAPVGYAYVRSDLAGYPWPPGELYFFLDFTVQDQHKMIKLYEYWCAADSRNPSSVKQIAPFQWPIGVKNAYHYYLNYAPPGAGEFHRDYWDRYIHLAWEDAVEMQRLFDFDETKFRDNFIRNLLKHDLEKHIAPPSR